MVPASQLKYLETAEIVHGIVDKLQDPNNGPYLLRCPINTLVDIPCLDGRQLGDLEIATGPWRGSFLYGGTVGGIELILPSEAVSNNQLVKVAAESLIYSMLVHAHQWARGEPFEGLISTESEDYIKSRLAQEAVEEGVSYLANKVGVLKAQGILKRFKPNNQKLQDFIAGTLVNIPE